VVGGMTIRRNELAEGSVELRTGSWTAKDDAAAS
jgi:hypothetical protein